MTGKFYLFTSFLFLFLFPLWGEVFSLLPGGGLNPNEISTLLGSRKVLEEPVIINGIELTQKIRVNNKKLRDILENIRKSYPQAKLAMNQDMLMLELKLDSEKRRKILFSRVGGAKYSLVEFSIDLPYKIPKNFKWPSELPLPFSSKPLLYVNYPLRKTWYGKFETHLRPYQAFAGLRAHLKSKGWMNFDEKGDFPRKKGDFFIKTNPFRIMTVKFTVDDSSGKTLGTLYKKYLHADKKN